jgi:hypothetical protein
LYFEIRDLGISYPVYSLRNVTEKKRCGSPVLAINSCHYNTAKQTAYHPLNTGPIIHELQKNKWSHAAF